MRGILDLFFNLSKDEHIGLNTIRPLEQKVETLESSNKDEDGDIGFLNLVKQSY